VLRPSRLRRACPLPGGEGVSSEIRSEKRGERKQKKGMTEVFIFKRRTPHAYLYHIIVEVKPYIHKRKKKKKRIQTSLRNKEKRLYWKRVLEGLMVSEKKTLRGEGKSSSPSSRGKKDFSYSVTCLFSLLLTGKELGERDRFRDLLLLSFF